MLSGNVRMSKENMAEFISKKRDMFLLQMSLNTKQEEIKKYLLLHCLFPLIFASRFQSLVQILLCYVLSPLCHSSCMILPLCCCSK